MNRHFEKLVGLLSRLPGIGPRQATRLALALSEKDPAEVTELSEAIARIPTAVKRCRDCFNLSEGERCAVCMDGTRRSSAVMVVEKVTDLAAMERAGLWDGRYHVLGGSLDPLTGTGPERLRITELERRASALAKAHGGAELILALNPNASGEATAQYLLGRLTGLPGLSITTLARGLSSGSHVEYADELTLRHAVQGRK